MSGVEFAGSALEALEGADACVLVTEWPEFAELDWRGVGRADGRAAGRRRPQLPRRRRGARGRLHLRGNRALTRSSAERVQALILAGGRGHAAAPAHLHDPQAGRPAGRSPVHRLHARVAARPRCRRGDPLLRLHGRRRAPVLGDGPARRPPALRRGARAAGHRRRAEVRRGVLEERFLMLNGDVLTDIDLTAQLRQHERTGARAPWP